MDSFLLKANFFEGSYRISDWLAWDVRRREGNIYVLIT